MLLETANAWNNVQLSARMLFEFGSKKRSCLSVCHLTEQSSFWGTLCLQSDLRSGSEAVTDNAGPRSPEPPIPTSFRTMRFFSEPHLLALLTDYFAICFLKRFKNPPHNLKILSCNFTLFHTLLLPPHSLMC